MSCTLHKPQFLFASSWAIFMYLIVRAPNVIASQVSYYEAPCSFFDTVNVTDDLKFENGSYLHDGVLIPSHLIGLYNYFKKDVESTFEAEPHWRGCICKLRPCINLCCPWGTIYDTTDMTCKDTPKNIKWPEKSITITFPNVTEKKVNLFERFEVINFRPACRNMYVLQALPGDDPENAEFKLYENGTELQMYPKQYLTKDDFCLMPTLDNDSDIYVIRPANCNTELELDIVKIINAFAMLFSVPFMLLTTIVYLAIPELRNHHGKSLVCYLCGLIVGYSLIAYINLIQELDAEHISCKVIGYTAYYCFMAAFFWLSVISFDMWHNFCSKSGINSYQGTKRFFIYCAYAWGSAALCFTLTWLAQEIADIPYEYKPSIGEGGYCWLDMDTWSAMIYFYGPVLIIIFSNTIMFVMTTLKINKVQKEMTRIIADRDSATNLCTEKKKFMLFFRLFMLMGVTWSMEILSYLFGSDEEWTRIFYISDVCNAIQGFIIFLLFVIKKKVKQLILKSNGSNQSSRTTSSRVS